MVQADILLLNSSIGGLATADIHLSKSPCTTTKTALVVHVQTMVGLAVLLYVRPVGTKVEALSATAEGQLHTMGTVPQSLVLIWNVVLATGTPLVETSTDSFQRHVCWLCRPESL